MMSLIFKCL